jgi:hypothetical protein
MSSRFDIGMGANSGIAYTGNQNPFINAPKQTTSILNMQ